MLLPCADGHPVRTARLSSLVPEVPAPHEISNPAEPSRGFEAPLPCVTNTSRAHTRALSAAWAGAETKQDLATQAPGRRA